MLVLCSSDVFQALISSTGYIQDWEDKQRHWEESPVLPFFWEVEEVEEDGGQDVENNGIQQQAGGNLLLQLLVLAAAFLQATYLLVTDCTHCDTDVLFASSITKTRELLMLKKAQHTNNNKDPSCLCRYSTSRLSREWTQGTWTPPDVHPLLLWAPLCFRLWHIFKSFKSFDETAAASH